MNDHSEEVKTYVWNKVRGKNKDPSFAKFEPSVSPELEIYYDEEHQIKNRIFHDHVEPATLNLTDLRKSDQEQYTLVISYVDYVGTPTEWIIDLQVQDVCFEKPKEVDNCTVTTCYTGDNGILKNPGNQTELVNGSKLLRVCDDSASGNYSCCNAAGTCLEQFLKVEAMEQFDTVGAFPVSDSLNNAIASFLWIFQLCINILMVLTSDALVRLSVY
ncbi:uncharacterized protein [Magallana gigas]|uniref:uncharacterized protein n=1 Tax=Magallana gigas TaxID=29159 RepID=UPI0033413B81